MSQPTPQRDQATAQPTPAGTPASPTRQPPLTTAERQRRYQKKRKLELEELKTRLSDGPNSRLTRENTELKIELKKAQEIAHEKSLRLNEMIESSAKKKELDRCAKDCIKNILYKASPGLKHVMESTLRERGYIEWLNSD